MPPPDPCVLTPTLPPCLAERVMEGAAGSIASGAWGEIVQSFARGVGEATKTLVTFWIQIPSPQGLDDPGSATRFLQQSTHWYVTAGAVLAVFVAAGRMALVQRGEPGTELSRGMVRLIFATFTGVPVIQALLVAGDKYSEWILGLVGENSLGARLTVLWGGVNGTSAAAGSAGPAMSSGLLFLIALITLLATLTQILLMLVRLGVITLLTGLWPLSASMSNTDTGRQWWQRSTAWLLAFVLYKPAGATVYATAFTMMGTGKDLTGFLAGTAMLALGVLTLPALLRLCVPAVGAASAGGGGGLLAATGGALATGAMATSRVLSGGLGSGGSGTPPPQGPSPSGSSAGSPMPPGSPEPGGDDRGPDASPEGSSSSGTTTVQDAQESGPASTGAPSDQVAPATGDHASPPPGGQATSAPESSSGEVSSASGTTGGTAPAGVAPSAVPVEASAGTTAGASGAAGAAGAAVTTVVEGVKTTTDAVRDLGDEATGAKDA